MEKICIVKLRKKLRGERCGLDVDPGSAEDPGRPEAADRTVALSLTRDQARVVQSHPYLASLRGAASARAGATIRCGDEAVVIKLELPALPPLRLLKPDEVTQMLRISRSSLCRMISEGKLKSYKFGKLRRIMLDDVLSCLEAHQQWPPVQQRPSQSKTSCKRMAQTYTIKEG